MKLSSIFPNNADIHPRFSSKDDVLGMLRTLRAKVALECSDTIAHALALTVMDCSRAMLGGFQNNEFSAEENMPCEDYYFDAYILALAYEQLERVDDN